MPDNELINSLNNTLGFKHIKIKDIDKVNDYFFIILDNGQKILTNGNELYDVSDYSYLTSMFNREINFVLFLLKNFQLTVFQHVLLI